MSSFPQPVLWPFFKWLYSKALCVGPAHPFRPIRRIEYCFDKESRKEIDVLQTDFNIETLSLRRKRNLVKTVHKTSEDKANIDTSRPNIDLRSGPKVKLKNKFTALTKVYNSPLYRGIHLWDQLPAHLQKEENKIKFKSEINRFNRG